MQFVTRDPAQQMEVNIHGYRNLVWPYYGKVAGLHEGPQAFLADLPEAGATIESHFHDVDQYQVIVRGGGRIGRDRAEPVVFHYADAYTPYGPIVGADEGIAFFTLRTGCASGRFSMPESRHLMPGKPGRNLVGKFALDRPLPEAKQSTRETLLQEADGVEVVGIRLGPDATASGEPADAGNQYYLVCSGKLLHEDKEFLAQSLLCVETGEPTPLFHAGPEGAQVLLLQLPSPSQRPGSDPKNLAWRTVTSYKLPEGAIGFE